MSSLHGRLRIVGQGSSLIFNSKLLLFGGRAFYCLRLCPMALRFALFPLANALLPFTARSLPHAPKQIVSHLFWNCYMLIIHLRIIHYLPMKRFGFPQRAEKQSAEEALENS